MTSSEGPYVRYSRVPSEDDGSRSRPAELRDNRFDEPEWMKRRIPWRSISLAVSLLLFGFTTLSLGVLMYIKHVPADHDQMWACFVVAFLTLLPGENHSVYCDV